MPLPKWIGLAHRGAPNELHAVPEELGKNRARITPPDDPPARLTPTDDNLAYVVEA
jgi:hypothetical protein